MFGLFNSKPRPEFEIPGIGTFYQINNAWHKHLDFFSQGNNVEITINTENAAEPGLGQIADMFKLRTQFDAIYQLVFDHLIGRDDPGEITLENFKELYTLVAITLEVEPGHFDCTFEPPYFASSRDGFFIMFVVRDGIVVEQYSN